MSNPQGGTLIFSIYIGSADFLGSNILISIFLGVFSKNDYVWGLEILYIYFYVSSNFYYFYGLFL